MFMDDLERLILRIRDRIQKHSTSLLTNEAETRYALINPVLSFFGWMLDDPSHIIAELPLGKGRCDYALFAGAEIPSVIIEAKALGTNVRDGMGQSIAYCLEHGVDYFGVTNGQVWEIYETRAAGAIDKKLVVRVDVQAPVNQTAMKLLWLWRGNFVHDEPAAPPLGPTLVQPAAPGESAGKLGPTTPVSTAQTRTATPEASQPKHSASGQPIPITSASGTPLANLDPKPFDLVPSAIRFPDGRSYQTSRWWELSARIVEWLTSTGRLDAKNCPVTTARGSFLVHTEPRRSTGEKFANPRQVGGLWFEAHGNASHHARQVKNILTACRIPLTDVFVDS